MNNMNKYKSIELYKNKLWEESSLIAPSEIRIAIAEDKAILSFYYATSLFRCGKYNDAMPVYRYVIDSDCSPYQYRVKAVLSLGIIAALKSDFAFSLTCCNEYKTLEGHDEFLARFWSYIFESDTRSCVDKATAIAYYKEIYDEKSKLTAQNLFSAIMHFTGNYGLAAWFFDQLKCEKIDSYLTSVAFESFARNGEIDRMQSITKLFETSANTSARMLVYNYMQLRLLIAQGEDEGMQLYLAKRIVDDIRNYAVFNIDRIVSICGEVFKSAERHDRVLVPSRFGIIGITPVISALRDRIDRFARSSSPVFIQGESGTGKELVAQALHDAGDRAGAPFIPINCAAVPESVFESQLFGHVAGAFTGAAKDQPGLFELAGEGTLFLDEVGELPLSVQAKLLRFLENGEYRRLGSDKILRSRARILAATNRSLVGDPSFRTDLYHRLRRLEIQVPALRERREDIRYLARHRIRQLNLQDGSGWKQLDEPAERMLEGLEYPGNVRELFNLVDHAWHEAVQPIGGAEVECARRRLEEERHRARATAPQDAQGQDLAVDFEPGQPWDLDFSAEATPLRLIQEQAAVRAIRQTLEHFGGDVNRAAAFLEVSRRSVYRYLERERGE